MRPAELGFTLMELLMATAIVGILAGGLSTAAIQAVTVPETASGHLIALHELENAAHWLQQDGQMASSATGGSHLVLALPDGTAITYSLTGTALERTSAGSSMAVAGNISAAVFTVSGRAITLDITSSPPGRQAVTRQATYTVSMRPSGGQR